MSRNRDYQRMLNSREWKELRASYLREHPLCEQCLAEGFNTPAIDCHHIIPVETANDMASMRRLAFSPNNLRALCIQCHVKAHKDLRSKSVEVHKQREESSLQRWIEKHNARMK